MPQDYADFPSLRFERPDSGILRVILDGPGLNSVGHQMHRDLADVWLAIDRDPDVRVAVIQGAGKAFSAGGSMGWGAVRLVLPLRSRIDMDFSSGFGARCGDLTHRQIRAAATCVRSPFRGPLTRGSLWGSMRGSCPSCVPSPYF